MKVYTIVEHFVFEMDEQLNVLATFRDLDVAKRELKTYVANYIERDFDPRNEDDWEVEEDEVSFYAMCEDCWNVSHILIEIRENDLI